MNAIEAVRNLRERKAAAPWVKSILLATDFSAASRKALHHAIAMARSYGAFLYLTHVVQPSLLARNDLEPRETRAATTGSQAECFFRNPALLDIPHEVISRKGMIWEELEKTIGEKKVDLVVVGTHGRQGLRKLILGSVAEQIFRRATCPVLTVGPCSSEDSQLEADETRSILFATDFGAASLDALKYAISLSSMHNARLALMHVVVPWEIPDKFPGCSIYSEDVSEWRREALVNSLRRLERLVSKTNGLPFAPEFVVEVGLPAERILCAANDRHAELIVIGLQPSAHITSASHLPGAVASEVVCGAVCPVLTAQR